VRSAVPPPAASPTSPARASDPQVRPVQGDPAALVTPPGLQPLPPVPDAAPPGTVPTPALGGQSLSLEAALYGALTSNPDLVTLRQGNPLAPSAEAVEVARRLPTTLNPTIWIDFRPITLIPPDTFGGGTATGPANQRGFYHSGNAYLYLSYRQPLELGHQTRHRFAVARAAYDQQRWTVVQAEVLALVQTYRLFQTAAYRRERLRVAEALADFNDQLLATLRRRQEANQVPAADVVLARVESRASRQQVKAASQDYLTALADLRNQIGIPETAGTAEPLGEFALPAFIPRVDEDAMIRLALDSRPEIRAAEAQIAGTQAAVRLAKGDRIPSPILGPEYQIDEVGVQYIGFVYITPFPIINNGTPLVRQRQAEAARACVAASQARQKVVAQVRAAVAKWNGAIELVGETAGLTDELAGEVADLERLFDEGQTDLTPLMQARQRLIQLENARLDATWQATQAQADLLAALGATSLLRAAVDTAFADSGSPTPPAPPGAGTAPPFPAPAAPR
jgi:cobalt-zinc-cadmium efflux system outer membrane protein